MKKEISIPTKASEIPLNRYAKFENLIRHKGEDSPFDEVLATLSGCTPEEARMIKTKDVEKATVAIVNALGDKDHPLTRFYTCEGVKYGFEPDLSQIPFGMFIDLCTFIDRPQTWHKAMAVLYRPVIRETSKMGGLYAIEDHDHTKQSYQYRQQIMAKAPSSLFLGARDFFLRGSKRLSKYILDSSTRQT